MSRLDPTSLELFVRVVESGKISAAAESAHISSAAVSKRLSEMEVALRTPLFTRTNKGVEPTAAGLALLKLARGVLHELDQIWMQMASFSTGTRGLVRICASMSAITQFLAEPLKSFVAQHPDVQLQLEEKTSPLVAKTVAENAADIGIFLPVVQGRTLEEFPFRHDRLVAITPKGHPLARRKRVAFKDLLEFELVGLHTSSAINVELSRIAQSVQRPLQLRFQVTSLDALTTMVSAGLGVGVMPSEVAKRHARTVPLQILPISDESARRHFLLGVRSMESLPEAARLMVKHLLRPDVDVPAGRRPGC